jgi:hypothetical protein
MCGAFLRRNTMSKAKSIPMTRESLRRITAVTIKENGGKIPAHSQVSRADAALQRAEAKLRKES